MFGCAPLLLRIEYQVDKHAMTINLYEKLACQELFHHSIPQERKSPEPSRSGASESSLINENDLFNIRHDGLTYHQPGA